MMDKQRFGMFMLAMAATAVSGISPNTLLNTSSSSSSSSAVASAAVSLTSFHPNLLPFDDAGLLGSLLGSRERRDDFFAEEFGRQMVHFSFSSSVLPSILRENIDVEVLYHSSPVTFRNRSSMDMVDNQRLSFEEFQSTIHQQGGSATFEISSLEAKYSHNPLLPFKRQLEHAFGLPLSFNVYHSGPGGSALRPHADRYDVLVIQLHGAKDWTLCIPRLPPNTTGTTWSSPVYNPADAASMADTLFRNDDNRPCGVEIANHGASHGCCKEGNHTLRHGMDCSQRTLAVGDVLFMPQGIVHVAQVPVTHRESTHAAIGFHKVPFRYADLLFTWLKLAATASTSPEPWKQLESLIQNDLLKSPLEGLPFRRLLPPWIWRHFQACLEDSTDKIMYEEASASLPPPRHWECEERKHHDAKMFLMQSLRNMVTILGNAALNHGHYNGWLDDLVLAECLRDESMLEDAIYVHLVEKIDFGTLEREERQMMDKSEHMHQQTLQIIEGIMGSSAFGGPAANRGVNGLNDLVASVTSEMKARQGHRSELSNVVEPLAKELNSLQGRRERRHPR
jgi:hypothetical protein